jgi:hypothetical protein
VRCIEFILVFKLWFWLCVSAVCCVVEQQRI